MSKKGNEKIKLKIGQIFRFSKDMEVEKVFGEKEIIPKGAIANVGADKLLHHRNGMIQPISEKTFDIEGYDSNGIANWLWLYIRNFTPVNEELLEDYDSNKDEFIEQLEYALNELGF